MKKILMFIILLAVSCSNNESIKIGYISNLTGRYSELGIRGRDGVLMAVNETNEKGGINGKQVLLVIKDHMGQPDLCEKAVKELIEEDVDIIIGPLISSMAESVLKGTSGSDMIVLSPTVSTDTLTGIDDNFIRLSSASSRQGVALGEIIQNRREKRIVIASDEGNKAYANDVVRGIKGFLPPEYSIDHLSYTRDEGLKPVIDTLSVKDMDAIIFISSGIDAAQIIQNINKQRTLPSLYGSSWVKVSGIINHGGKLIEGMIIPDFFNLAVNDEEVPQFVKNYTKRYNIEPGLPAVYCYEAATLFLDLRRRYGNIKGIELKKALTTLPETKGVFDTFSIDPYGDVERKLYLYEIRNGNYELMAE